MLLNAVSKTKGAGAVRNCKLIISIVALALLLMTVSGCFTITADELYSLPQASEEYVKLQEQINTVLAPGTEYSPPTFGPNRQSVQLKDIDSDGVNEAIAFFRTTGDKPLKIYIMEQTDGTYRTADVIEGDGVEIESIRYADMDGDGVSEFIVGWQASAVLLHMSIYSIRDYQHALLKDSDYAELVVNDMNNDGNMDVVALRLPSSDFPGEAEMFFLMPDGEISNSLAPLSKGIESITSVVKGNLSDGTPAIFVEGGYTGGNVVTDLLTWRYNDLVNVTASKSSGVSEDTLRAYSIYSTDINKDDVVEVPSPRLLESSSDTKYYSIDWSSYDRFGNKSDIFTTYHDFSDGWYLILPDDWEDSITVRRDDTISGERTLIFSYLTETDSVGEEIRSIDFLKIYTLSGDNKDDRARLEGRFKLLEHGEIICAAEILTTEVPLTVNKAIITENFRPLYSDWTTGVI